MHKRMNRNQFTIGQRVMAHPGTDSWMRGDRWGWVTKIGRRYIHVQMDASGKTVRFDPSLLLDPEQETASN